MIGNIIELLTPVARMLDRRDSTKFEREVLDLKEKIYEEENKSPDERDDGKLHNYHMRIMRLCKTLGNTFEKKKSKGS